MILKMINEEAAVKDSVIPACPETRGAANMHPLRQRYLRISLSG